MPVSAEKRLLPHYPAIKEIKQEAGKFVKRIVRSGSSGDEAFEFELVEQNGKIREFDNARLRINTNKCKLVIVDGQHRAMALLALYRNLKGWPDKTASFREYYRRWTNIPKDNLKDITLPIVVCAFPTLAEETKVVGTIIEASRAVFLALNKHAKPVSTARNILLDDSDLIAHFERSILETVRQIDSSTSQHSLRLWNFELDADENRIAVFSTVAISGVMHLFSMLERVLLSTDMPTGLFYPTRKYGNIKNIQATCLRRLDGSNLLGDELAQSTSRYAFTSHVRDLLVNSFQERYGKYIVQGYQKFWPFEAMTKAAHKLETEIRLQRNDWQNHANLFEGQGILRVFDSYIDQLSTELDEKYPNKQYPPDLGELLEQFKGTKNRLIEFQDQFSKMRTCQLFSKISKTKIVEPIYKAIHELYRTMFTTSAFQTALFITFFSAVESLNADQKGGVINGDAEDDVLFEEYINSLNLYFYPQKEQQVNRLLNVFSGKVSGEFGTSSMKISDSEYILRKIVIPGELKPDEWPKFRYILLEMWQTKNAQLQTRISDNVKQCRDEVLKQFDKRLTEEFCKKKGIDISEMTNDETKEIHEKSLNLFIDALKELIGTIPKEELKRLKNILLQKSEISPEESSVIE